MLDGVLCPLFLINEWTGELAALDMKSCSSTLTSLESFELEDLFLWASHHKTLESLPLDLRKRYKRLMIVEIIRSN